MKEKEKGEQEKFKNFKETVLITAKEVCGAKKIGQKSKR